ncbi:MAG: minor capsid protein [Pseudomonadota bacterium]
MKVWLKPNHYERRYSRFLLKLVTELRTEILKQLSAFNVRKDDETDDTKLEDDSNKIESIIATLLLWWSSRRQNLYVIFGGYFNEINQFNDDQFRLVVKSLTGLVLPSNSLAGYVPGNLTSSTQDLINKFGSESDIYRQELYLSGIKKNWTTAQQVYIDKVIQESISNTELALRNAIVRGVSAKELVPIVDKLLTAIENKVDRFAKDQVNDLDTQLTSKRQQSIGADGYIWETRRDERVRGNPDGLYPNAIPSHFHRQGVTFYWDMPPEGGHPGQAPGCRCSARLKLAK